MTEQPSPTHAEGSEAVHHPSHYNELGATCIKCGHPIECVDVAETMDFLLGNALKYLWRALFKGNPIQDLRKAIWYIERKIAKLEKAATNAR